MDNREAAIEWFSMLKEKFVKTEYEGYLDMAISALEKQIPKRKLEKSPYNENLFGLRCPSCGERVGNYNGWLNTFSHMALINYCPKCGQAIDFSKPQREEQDG